MAFSWNELRRRNVVKVAIAYAVVSWLILQLTDVLISLLSLEPWFGRAIVVLVAIGFVPVIVFSWIYEVTPDGIRPQSELDETGEEPRGTGKKLDRAIIAVLSVAVVIFAIDEVLWDSGSNNATPVEEAQKSIAVLPFVNMSSDPEQEYFSDGLTEELLSLLARVPELRVTSRSSVFFYKDKEFQIADVGRDLGVTNILEGSVRRSGNDIRIAAKLIDVSSDTQIWSENWDRTLEDIFDVQDEIAKTVVDELRIRLLGETPKAYVTSPEAYSLYLQGLSFESQFTAEGDRQAEVIYLRVLEIDNSYVPAWIRLAANYIGGSASGAWHPHEVIPKAKEAAHQVLDIDPESAAAHAILARIARNFDYNRAEAQKEIQIAIELAPNELYVLQSASGIARFDGQFDEAVELSTEIAKLDPLSWGPKLGLGYSYIGTGRFNQARTAFSEILDLAPVASQVHYRIGTTYLATGDLEQALAYMNRERRDGFRMAGRTMILHAMGDHAAAIK